MNTLKQLCRRCHGNVSKKTAFFFKIAFLTKINIPAKFKENWLKTWESHLYQFSLALNTDFPSQFCVFYR